MSTHIKFRAMAYGAGKTLMVFPRAKVTMSSVSAASSFMAARKEIASASKQAEGSVWGKRETPAAG